jgi:hypothetical protein
MKDIAKEKKKLNPSFNEQMDVLKKKMKSLKMEAKADKAKRLNDQRIKLHKSVTSFVSNGWPEDYETLKSNITSIIEE